MMGMQTAHHVGELSEIASVRRAGNELARRLGFGEVRAGQLAIVITEAATNIVKHAREGEILLRELGDGARTGVEVVAIDRGPGMANVALRMEDGNSTAGTYGVGLGAIRRLSQEFDLYSAEGLGTVMLMTLWIDGVVGPLQDWLVGAVCVPLAGEDACGDAWAIGVRADGLAVGVADGLGHGPDAARASEPAVKLVAEADSATACDLVTLAHGALRGTRGAALAVALIDTARGELSFCGVGNIAGCIAYGSTRRHLMSHNGIVGSNLRKTQEFRHEWKAGALLILHSDGIATRWDVDAYPGLGFRHPALIAAVLYRDFARPRDDSLVLVIREREKTP